MYRDIAQWKMVRRKVLEEGVSRRHIAKETGLSRRTIRKMLLHELPQPFTPRSPRYPKMEHHRATLDAFSSLNNCTPIRHCVSISEVFRYLQREESYSGSYGAVRDYLKCQFRSNRPSSRDVWEDLYELIVSMPKKDAIEQLRSLSLNGSPLISPTSIRRLQRDIDSLREHKVLGSRYARTEQDVDWIHRVLRGGALPSELEGKCRDPAELKELITRLRFGTKPVRNRALATLAHLRDISDHTIATALGMSRVTIRRCRKLYEAGGVGELFARKTRPGPKISDEGLTNPYTNKASCSGIPT